MTATIKELIFDLSTMALIYYAFDVGIHLVSESIALGIIFIPVLLLTVYFRYCVLRGMKVGDSTRVWNDVIVLSQSLYIIGELFDIMRECCSGSEFHESMVGALMMALDMFMRFFVDRRFSYPTNTRKMSIVLPR